MKSAVILLSGGLDSATVLAIAKSEGYLCYALSFDYGQRHQHELVAASAIAQAMHVAQHVTAKIDLRAFGGSALTANIPVPKDQLGRGATASSPIPITYVPARNTVFLSFALAWAEVLKSFDIFIGVNAIDYSGYPDCRPQFIQAFENLANLATAAGVEGKGQFHIHIPLIDKTKAQIIQWGQKLNVNYALTHSCYDPLTAADGKGGMTTLACGHCDSCQLRREGFKQAGLTDPIAYAS